ncbi:putative sugar kinase slr0537 [Camellia lanceoleosa]|uniref:Sugar kinase slr0537 n=1 Tax=Camellia lanceoleosa TaxID=1840588 RepID=A0ACC0GRT3_9ERIC|nr:putative sugar kinase slr0537 [Camellia lanceoleosa]
MKHFLRSPLGVKTSVISEVIMGEGYLREIIGNYADVVFANSDEARAFCHFSSKESPASATRYQRHFVPLVSFTDGPKGSYIGVKGEAVYIPPSPCVPVDTCGAGDAYASGITYGILRGVSI